MEWVEINWAAPTNSYNNEIKLRTKINWTEMNLLEINWNELNWTKKKLGKIDPKSIGRLRPNLINFLHKN